MESQTFKAGAGRCDITPPLGTLINGDFISHYARSIHDPLYAKALVLQKGKTLLCFLVVDICCMHKDFLDQVKKEINAQTGIRPDHILISSTHTHAAGSVESLLLGAADLPYRQKLPPLLVQAVVQAIERLRPAKIAFGAIDAPEHVVCRRYFMKPGYKAYNPVTGALDQVKTNPAGHEDQIERRESPVDPQLSYLAVRGMDDQWISLLANYSMHYVGDWENGVITADYFGVFDRELSVKLAADSDFVGIMTNGTSGDANIMDFLQLDRYPKGHFEKSALIGSDLAEKVVRSLEEVAWQEDPALDAGYREIPIKLRKPSVTELREAESILADTHYETLKLKDSHTGNEDGFKRIYAREQLLLQEFPERISFPVQLLRIGNGSIGGLGGEIFSETGLWLKQAMREIAAGPYFTICLANDSAGYIPPPGEFALGGYETWRNRSSCLEQEAERIIREQLVALARMPDE